MEQERYEDALPFMLDIRERSLRTLGGDHLLTIESEHNLGVLEFRLGRHAEAEPLLLDSLASFRRVLGDDHPSIPLAMEMLPLLYEAWGRSEEAERYRAELERIQATP